jgi:DNA polymerase-3 subunit delta'
MSREPIALPESDRLEGAPHPRETLVLFGHEAAERELLDAYQRNRLAQAWIIGGPEGVGKATLAWRFARFLLTHPDPEAAEVQGARTLDVPADSRAARRIKAMAAADIFLLRRSWNEKSKKLFTEIRVDDVRDVINSLHQSSGTNGWRVAIVDCADELNKSSANALLKLIEEPPTRSLFLLVAHSPGRLLPTIRSRCRKLMLAPLSEKDVARAVRALGAPWSGLPDDAIDAASARSEGSVREALRLLAGNGVAFDTALFELFERLPHVDWPAVHALSDRLVGRDNEAAYESFMRALQRWMDARVKGGAAQGAASLIGYARAWEEITQAARETEIYNFDRKALVVGIFTALERAASEQGA